MRRRSTLYLRRFVAAGLSIILTVGVLGGCRDKPSKPGSTPSDS